MLGFEDISRDDVRAVFLNVDLIQDRLAPILDLVETLLERVDPTSNESDMVCAIATGGSAIPEEIGRTHVVEFIERAARLLHQAKLSALGLEAFEFLVHRLQIPDQLLESFSCLPEFLPEHVFVVVVSGLIQGITLVLRELCLGCFLKDGERDLGVPLAGAGRHDPLDYAERDGSVRQDRDFLTLSRRSPC